MLAHLLATSLAILIKSTALAQRARARALPPGPSSSEAAPTVLPHGATRTVPSFSLSLYASAWIAPSSARRHLAAERLPRGLAGFRVMTGIAALVALADVPRRVRPMGPERSRSRILHPAGFLAPAWDDGPCGGWGGYFALMPRYAVGPLAGLDGRTAVPARVWWHGHPQQGPWGEAARP